MSAYEPPTQNLAIFDPDVFTQNDEPLTITTGAKYFLKYPNAQGTENLQAVNINGVLTANSSTDLNGQLFVNGTSSFDNNLTMTSNDPNESQITCGYLNLKDLNGNVARTAEIYQDSLNLVITNEATSGKTQFNNDTAGGIPTLIMELDQPTGIVCQRPLTINTNNNLTMPAGTGRINQSLTSGDISTTNNFKKTVISYNNNGAMSGVPALEIFENAGRGAYFVPNTQSGNFGPNVGDNDFSIVSRFFSMATTSLCFATGTALRNHLRLFATTDLSNCSLVLQNGGNLIANASEFRMDYNFNATPQNTASFNNPINFNPTNNGAISATRRALNGLGTLSFTDLSANSTSGSFTSQIYTDSSLVSGMNGMYYNTNINGGNHIFKNNDINGVNSTSLSLNGDLNTTYNRFYQEIQPTWNKVNGYYELAKDAQPSTNPMSTGVASVSTWTTRTTTIDLEYYSVAWSPELLLFCAVSNSGSGGTGIDRVITSPDGITWTNRNCFAVNWRYIIWVPELKLFVATGISGTTSQRVMTSPDGINWTLRTTPNDNNWRAVCWSAELNLLVSVADSGTERVMTSPDGINWTSRNQVNTNGWSGICWSGELGIFVAVGNSGTGTRVMTSPDGITWTLRTSAADNTWRNVVWASEIGLFVAISSSGVNNRVMTSPNGINWTIRTTNSNGWREICWSPELKLFCAVADSGTNNLVMTSPDGINWTTRTTNSNIWLGICWSPELGIFCSCAASGTNDRIMTSSFQGRPPTNFNVFKNGTSNSIDENGNWTLTSNLIYATQLDIRRSTTIPLSRLEIVNDGANSSYIKSRCPSGQSVLFLNTYNGTSDDETMSVSSARIQVRRPIQFSYLTTPGSSNQLGWFNSVNIIGSAYTTQSSPNSMGEIILLAGTWSIEANYSFTASGNHTYTVFSYGLSTSATVFPTALPYVISYIQEPGLNINTNTATRQTNLTLQLSSTTSVYILERVAFGGGGTTNISVNYSITRIG